MKVKKQVVWDGELTGCDICKGPFDGTMYDAATTMGPWANMCSNCFAKYGRGDNSLGAGVGQKYKLIDGKFVADSIN
jgi:hypothetical protein